MYRLLACMPQPDSFRSQGQPQDLSPERLDRKFDLRIFFFLPAREQTNFEIP